MKKVSAGLLMYRMGNNQLEVFLVHPGGPYFTNKNSGYWGIPKGEVEPDEPYQAAAIREFTEETGILPEGEFISLGSVVLRSGKTVHAWAFQGNLPAGWTLQSNLFSLEWPPNSRRQELFPEIDKAEFFPLHKAFALMNSAQTAFLMRLQEYLGI